MSLTLQNQTQSQTRVRNSRSELVQYQYFTKILNLNLEHSNSVRLSQIHQCWWHCRIRIRVRPESDQSQTRVRSPVVRHPGVNDIVESDSPMSMTLRSQNFVCIYYITTMSSLFENIFAYKRSPEAHRIPECLHFLCTAVHAILSVSVLFPLLFFFHLLLAWFSALNLGCQ